MSSFIGNLIYRIVDAGVRAYDVAAVRRLKMSLASCGEDVHIGKHVVIWGVSNVHIGSHVGIHSLTHIFGAGGVTIGSNVYISAGCSIASITHSIEVETRYHGIEEPVVIEDDVWLGTGVIVLSGVTIGRGAVVGAGSVVTRDVPEMSVVRGVPAKIAGQVPLSASTS
jgi:maltose O-acetyltransferase